MKTPRPPVPARTRDSALGRETRGLVGPVRRGRTTAAGGAVGSLRRPGRIVTATRAAGLLGMLASGFVFTFVTGPTAFALARTELPPLTWTDPLLVKQVLGVRGEVNVFRLDTTPLEAGLRALPAVASAEVAITLPGAALVVTIEERSPVIAWQVGDTRFIADREGIVFATLASSAPLPPGVAVIEDRRADGTLGPAAIGSRLDAVDFDVATRLGSLTPTDIGSTSKRLTVAITDADGFVVSTSGGWVAVFGFYSPATRPTDMIPGQVRLLRSLLAGREDDLARIILASATDGTYLPKATPRPTAR